MAELGGLRLQLYMGPVVALPVPGVVMDHLVSVQVTENALGQGGFQLTFAAGSRSLIAQALLPLGLFDAPNRVILTATRGVEMHVLMDGIISRHELSTGNEPGGTTLTVTGVDLSEILNRVDFSGIPWPAMPPSARVSAILAKYAAYGLVSQVVPSVLVAVPNPLETVFTQKGTDLAYVRKLARDVGYVFYVEPGPAPGSSRAYWGPEVKFGEVQPALTVNMDQHSNVESLSIGFDGLRKTVFVLFVQDPDSKATIPIPLPDVGPLNPPLGVKPPIPLSYTRLGMDEAEEDDDSTGKYDVVTAAARGLARASQASDVISASGSLDVARYGHVLRPRRLVSVRGTGRTHDGYYYVQSVSHDLRPGVYKQRFRLTRNALISQSQVVPV